MYFPSRVAALCLTLASVAAIPCAAQNITPHMQALYQRAHAEQDSHPDAAITDYRALLKLAPTLGAAYNNLGRLLYAQGRFSEAVSTLRTGLQVDPSMTPAQVLLGASLYQTGDAAGAIAPLTAAAAALPDDHFVHLTLARALLATEQTQAAAAALEQLTRRDPKDAESWYLLGKAQLDLSRESFAHVQQVAPDSVVARDLAGELMESMGNYPEAVAAYKQGLAQHPGDLDLQQHLANAYYGAGDWANALAALQPVLQGQPRNCVAYWKVAKAMNELAEPALAAAETAQKAITLCPKLAPAYLEQARAQLRNNQVPDAITALKKAEAITPDEPSIQALLARAYQAQGQTALAAAANAHFRALTAAEHSAEERRAAAIAH